MPILMVVLGRFVSITCGMLTLVGAGCGESDDSPGPPNSNQQSATPSPGGSSDTGEVWFVDIAEITGLHHETIRRGRDELQNDLADRPTGRIRCPGGGRPRVEKKIPR